MQTIAALSDRLAKGAFALAGLILVYSVCHILLETALRSLLGLSTHVLDEFIGFSILSITFLSLAWTLRSGTMIRVNLVTALFPHRLQTLIDRLVSAAAFALMVFFCLYFFRNFLKDWSRGAVSERVAEVPLWIPDLVVLTGAVLLALQFLARIFAISAPVATPKAH